VNPDQVSEMEVMQRQLLLFAQDLQTIVASERTQREDAEAALRELSQSYLTMVKTLALVCEMKDNYTRHHLDRTYQYAIALTRRVAPELANDASVGYGYLLHDIGKVGIPDAILNKPGPLDEDEWRVMRTHPVIGLQLVQPIKFLGDAMQIVKSHHERWDGRGYPEGKQGEDIYLPARIFSIIDTFDAMTSDRPYRKGLPVHVAMEEIERCGGTQFDPELARAFVQLCEDLKLAETEPTALTTLR
jgi:HD-GYP domain-containing protein (c-di-GMP phosphodiesterase class II)